MRAIFCHGWSSRSQSQPKKLVFPPFVYPISSVPHDWLFPLCCAVVHHGGSGTTAAGIRAGVPTIIHPFFGDQFFWAGRVEEIGIGVFLRKLKVESLSEALKTVTTDFAMQNKAKALGAAVRLENGVKKAIEFVYRDLDYSSKIISDLANKHN